MKIVDISKSITTLLKQKGWKPFDLAKRCENTTLDYIYKIIQGRNKNVGIEKILDISQAFELSYNDFIALGLSNEQPSFVKEESFYNSELTSDQKELLNLWSSLDEDQKIFFLKMIAQIPPSTSSPKSKEKKHHFERTTPKIRQKKIAK